MARTNRGTLIAQAAWWARAGELELASEAFRDAFAALLDRPVAVVATVQSASHSFTDALKRRRDVETLRVATTNRNELPELLAALLRNAR
jgi:nucleoside-triphosphatase THEP1